MEVEILAILGEARERLVEERRRGELLLWLSLEILSPSRLSPYILDYQEVI